MTPATIRALEIWLGRPLCGILTLHRRVAGIFDRGKSLDKPVKRILFLKLTEQGSTVLTCDALRRAAEMVGSSNLYYCTFEENREIVDVMQVIPRDNVLTLRMEPFALLLVDAFRMVLQTRRLSIDATIDLEHFARAPAILAYLSGASHRVGLHRFTSEAPYRGDLMTHRVLYNPYLHTAQLFSLLVHALSMDPAETPLLKIPPPTAQAEVPRFRPGAQERNVVRRLLDRTAEQPAAGAIILLNPNTNDRLFLRKWPGARFVELGQRLLGEYPNLHLVITGTLAERQSAEEVRLGIGSRRVTNLTGQTTLREAIVLYTLADILVTNDSGPSHFASLTDIDIVSLFGPETPRLYGPLGSRTHVITAGLACSPCLSAFNNRSSPCRNNLCMQAITVEQVISEVRMILSLRQGSSGGSAVSP